jgi:DNA-binding NarL/FixJ family response regulator
MNGRAARPAAAGCPASTIVVDTRGVSPQTVRQHSMAILRKPGVGDRREAVVLVMGGSSRPQPAF